MNEEEKKSYIPTIKTYNTDYSFIISNYLDQRLWDKAWNLFVYKDILVTLCLKSIDTKNKTITFEIQINGRNYTYRDIKHNLRNSTIIILKKQINGAIESLLKEYEDTLTRKTSEYASYKNFVEDEEYALREIAIGFLDRNNVSNGEIREVYIDGYIYNNSQLDDMLSSYLSAKRYTLMPDLFLTYGAITNNEVLTKAVLSKMDEAESKEAINKISEYIKYLETEDFTDDMESQLEQI